MIKTAIIGGGASGLCAAIKAARNGAIVTIFEKNERVGQKLLKTGSGRCNFTNAVMNKDCYYCDNDSFVENTLNKFSNEDCVLFFAGLGVMTKDKNGYIYPSSECASTVLDALRLECNRLDITIHTNSLVSKIEKKNNFLIYTANCDKPFVFDRVILASGGKAGLSPKETVNGYELAAAFGHTVTPLYPALTRLKCEGLKFASLKGIRTDADLYLFSNEDLVLKSNGELLFTDSGISGIVTFQLSSFCSKLLAQNKNVMIVADLIPGYSEVSLRSFLLQKLVCHPDDTLEEFCVGLFHKMLNLECLRLSGLKPGMRLREANKEDLINAVLKMKEFPIKVLSTDCFENSQVTSGGVVLDELTPNFESKLVPGLFITGELLDVDGLCGGYNLQWAFSSGAIAGEYSCL